MDEGMSHAEAEALARVVRDATAHAVSVESDDGAFIVTVRRSSGDVWTLYHQQDWDWLGERIRTE